MYRNKYQKTVEQVVAEMIVMGADPEAEVVWSGVVWSDVKTIRLKHLLLNKIPRCENHPFDPYIGMFFHDDRYYLVHETDAEKNHEVEWGWKGAE